MLLLFNSSENSDNPEQSAPIDRHCYVDGHSRGGINRLWLADVHHRWLHGSRTIGATIAAKWSETFAGDMMYLDGDLRLAMISVRLHVPVATVGMP